MDADLRGGHRTAADLRSLRHGEALEIVEDEGRPIVGGQAVDDTPDTGVHLVDNELLVNRGVRIRHFGRFVKLDDVHSVRGLAKVVGRDPCGDGERPRLHAGAGTEARKAPRNSNERFLEQILRDRRIAHVALEVAQEWLGQLLRKLWKRCVMLHGCLPEGRAVPDRPPFADYG